MATRCFAPMALMLAMVTSPFVFVGAAHAGGQVVVSSWGGLFQTAERQGEFEPFEKATGIKVVEATMPYASRIKVMEQSGNIEWDVAEVVPSDFYILERLGMLEKINYSYFNSATLSALENGVALPYGVGTVTYGRVISWNTKCFPPGTPHPETMADVWNVKKFPGKRALDSGAYTFPPDEYALLAAGVPADKLYPIDFKLVYKMLTQIRPYVVKWAQSSQIVPEALADGEACAGVASLGRIAQLKREGAPVDYTLNQDLLKRDYWVVPKGAKDAENAMRFIAFASEAKPLAYVSVSQLDGPPNRDAFKYIPATVAKELPTYAENEKTAIYINDKWWAEIDPKTGKSYREANVDLWSAWATGG